MHPRTEEFLNLLLWSAHVLTRPTFRNLSESYEAWAYRNGLKRRVMTLERKGMIERNATARGDRLYRLSAQGRLHVLGGRDPQELWARPWDGQWRLVLFDVPSEKNTERERLRRYLRDNGFGCLQRSVWISPHPLEEQCRLLGDAKINVKSLLLLEARFCAEESDADIVASAWDFDHIARRYARHLSILDERPIGAAQTHAAAKSLLQWAATEREAWLKAVTNDPLLPAQLLPPGYLGQEAWRRRVEVLREAGKQLRTFRLE
jgi:phenylacetic acid degradation operon negative regulatory protein